MDVWFIPFGTSSLSVTARTSPAQLLSSTPITWDRHYKLGDTFKYEMQGENQGWKYQVAATDKVVQDAACSFYEEIAWLDLHSNAPMTLSPLSPTFRQNLSLDGTGKYITVPDLSKVQPLLIGPITDTLTFYSDLLIAKRENLSTVGQHVYVEHGKPNSWADGLPVLIGQDAIDFDLTLAEANRKQHTLTFLIRHVPPKQSQIRLEADWMQKPVSDTPNNWVQVSHSENKYVAEIGKETFEVRITISSEDGKILSALLDNPIVAVSRECDDAELHRCSPATPETIHRRVEFKLQP